jgi:hypothetical protein
MPPKKGKADPKKKGPGGIEDQAREAAQAVDDIDDDEYKKTLRKLKISKSIMKKLNNTSQSNNLGIFFCIKAFLIVRNRLKSIFILK